MTKREIGQNYPKGEKKLYGILKTTACILHSALLNLGSYQLQHFKGG